MHHRQPFALTVALAITCFVAVAFCQTALAATSAATSAPASSVTREPNGDYRVILRSPRSTGLATEAAPTVSENEVLTECTLWSNEPSTNECLNPSSPELVGYGKAPKSAVGRGKEKTPVGTFRFLKYYELSEEELPVGSQVLEATQTEYLNSATKKKAPIPVGLYAVTSPWTMKASWEKASGTTAWTTSGGDYTGTSAVIDPSLGEKSGTVSWNVKQLVQEWANRSTIAPGRLDYGFMLADSEYPTTVENVLSFDNKPGKEGYLEYYAEPDTTPPTVPQRFDAMLEPTSGQTTVSWEGSTDPPFPDGYPGSGVASYNYRYETSGGTWSSWASTSSPSFVLSNTTSGEQISVEVDAVDNAKNVSRIAAGTLTSTGPTLTPEHPGSSLPGEAGEVYMVPEPEEYESFDARLLSSNSAAPAAEPAASGTYTEKPCATSEACGTFNGPAAAVYGERWSFAGVTEGGKTPDEIGQAEYERHDRSFGFFGGHEGGDCTNFASAALHAGGMQYMRSHGDDNPNGDNTTKADSEEYLKGEGAWWSYYIEYPFEGTNILVRSYEVTRTFVRAGELYEHLVQFGLGRVVHNTEYVKPGDLVFYDLDGTSMEPEQIDHTQVVIHASHSYIYVAQHSSGYIHSLNYVIEKVTKEKGALHQHWNFTIVEPDHTEADIPLSN
jgi:hypothetical protein